MLIVKDILPAGLISVAVDAAVIGDTAKHGVRAGEAFDKVKDEKARVGKEWLAHLDDQIQMAVDHIGASTNEGLKASLKEEALHLIRERQTAFEELQNKTIIVGSVFKRKKIDLVTYAVQQGLEKYKLECELEKWQKPYHWQSPSTKADLRRKIDRVRARTIKFYPDARKYMFQSDIDEAERRKSEPSQSSETSRRRWPWNR